jgi:hypothetical protein
MSEGSAAPPVMWGHENWITLQKYKAKMSQKRADNSNREKGHRCFLAKASAALDEKLHTCNKIVAKSLL